MGAEGVLVSPSNGFKPATKKQAKARIAFDGPSGSGKTYTALTTATVLAFKGRVAVIDSERGSASKYADLFRFDVVELAGDFHPDRYLEGIRMATEGGYDVLVIDSLTHAWSGPNGVLEVVDGAKSRFGGNSYMAWSVGTPLWQGLIDAILACPMHVIVTMRSKTKFVEEENAGKKSYRRAGTEPVARDGVEYEFDIVGDLDLDHTLVVSKSRAGKALKGVYRKPGPEFGDAVLAWLQDGAPDTDARSKELAHIVGKDGAEELAKQLKANGIKSKDDLASEENYSKAKGIANGIVTLNELGEMGDEEKDADAAYEEAKKTAGRSK